MANYATLKAAIDAVIKANGQREITGTVLNQTLNAMVNSLGTNYQLAGVATPSTNPGTPDQNVFYLAFEAGTYTNFNATVLSAGISILMWNGSWSSQTFYTIDATPTASSNNLVSSGAVFDAIKTDGSAYDVSVHFPTAGPNNDGKFTLEYILSNVNTLIPTAWRKGGMSIRFVSSSDNKYVQYRLLATSFTTNDIYWQKQGAEVSVTGNTLNIGNEPVNIHNNLFLPLPNIVGSMGLNGIINPEITTFSTSDYFRVNPGDIVAVTCWPGNNQIANITTYDESKQRIEYLLAGTQGQAYNNVQTTIPSGVCFVRISFANSTHANYIESSISIISNYDSILKDSQILSNAVSMLDWSDNTEYVVGNQRKYNGKYYRCTTAHTSGESFDSSKWTEIADFDNTILSKNAIQYGGRNDKKDVYQQNITLFTVESIAFSNVPINSICYSPDMHLLRWKNSESVMKTLPYYNGAVYICDGCIYVWDGASLVKHYEYTDGLLVNEKKIVSADKIVRTIFTEILFTVHGNCLTNTGTLYSASNFDTTDYIEVKKGDIITLAYYTGNPVTLSTMCGYSTKNESSFVQILIPGANATTKSEEYTIPDGIRYIRIASANSNHPNYRVRYAGILSTNRLDNELTNLTENTFIINNLPTDSRLDANFVLKSSASSVGWYKFQNTNGTVVVEDDYIKITAPDAPNWSGIRSDTVLNLLAEGSTYEFSFDYKLISGTPVNNNIAFSYNNNQATSIPVNSQWLRYTYRFTYNPSVQTRLQIAKQQTDTNIVFAIKNAKLELVDSIEKRIEKLEEHGSALNGKNVVILGDSISTHGTVGHDPNTVEIKIQTEDVGKTLSAYVTKFDVDAGLTLGGTTYTASDIGNEVTFVPTAEDVGKVIGLPKTYYDNSMNVWWTYVRDFFKCNIIPVCWSGSGLTRNRENESENYVASYAWHESQIRKCGIRTPGTMNRTAPDVIIITRGANDWSHAPYAMLTAGYFDNYNVQYPNTDVRQDGEYGFKEAYFMTIGKLREAYPFAKIILCTYPVLKRVNCSHFPMNNGYYSEPQYNNAVREIANFCGCDVIDFDKCGITFENMYPTYMSDSATYPVHPNVHGHEVMGKYAETALMNMTFTK